MEIGAKKKAIQNGLLYNIDFCAGRDQTVKRLIETLFSGQDSFDRISLILVTWLKFADFEPLDWMRVLGLMSHLMLPNLQVIKYIKPI